MTPSPFPARLRVVLLGALATGMVSCLGWPAGTGKPPRTGTPVAEASQTSMPSVTMRPRDGDTVGVGMPVILRFSAQVALQRRLEVLDRIRVTSTPAVRGAWHWFAPDEVHWRPATYWSPGTVVAVTADLGREHWWKTFTVGPRHVSIVDTVRHRMRVFDGDRLIATWPLSAGRSDLQTISGTLYVRYKEQDVLMDSTSIGIPRDAWDGYYEHVYWNTAISSDGYYVHGAPWSLASQGVRNVSHGCVNLSPEHAQTFYNFSRPGDVVIVRGSTKLATGEDGEGDWQMTFAEFARSSTERTVF
jgi:lipoprotein-anchoring transpeptidase ErfK/SrfK